ncbi:MAG: tetratricopeptide repeat protein [Calditrichaeota bacterium]|nr:MAG: tetratricopeptide repeat protein [Calditrichota bacterium]
MKHRQLALSALLLSVCLFSLMLPAQSKRVVGLIPFYNEGEARYHWVSKGIDQLLTDKFSSLHSVLVYEKETLNRVLRKLGARDSRAIDARRAFSIGKQTGIEVLVLGSYRVTGNTLHLKVRLVSTYTGSAIFEESTTEPLENLFSGMTRLVKKSAEIMQLPVSSREMSRLSGNPTQSLAAFEEYCKGYLEIDKDSPMEIIAGYFQRALQLDPNFWEARYNLGVIFYNFRLYKKALHQFDTVIQGNPEYYKPYFGKGVIYYLNREYRKALQELKNSIRYNPEHDRSYYYLGIVYTRLDSLKKGIQALEQSIDLNPDYAPAHYQLGLAEMKRGWFKKAVTALTRATRLNPDFYQAHNALGEAYYAQNNFEEAIIEFKKAIELKPNFATAYFNLGNSIYRRGALAEIVDAFWALIEVQYVPAGTNGSGKSPLDDLKKLREKSRIEDASTILRQMVDAYRTALKYDQRFYEASYNLALTYEKLEKPDSAEYYYRLALKQKPDLPQAHMRLGKLYEKKGKYDQAFAEYKEVVKIAPDFFAANPRLGEKFRFVNIVEHVLNEYQARLEKNPRDVEALRVVAKIYLSMGRFGQAEHYFEQLAALSPSDPTIQQQLREIRRRLRKL